LRSTAEIAGLRIWPEESGAINNRAQGSGVARAAQDRTIVDMAGKWNIVFPFQRDIAGT
jgi:Zn/Cd-binding protein ZinT